MPGCKTNSPSSPTLSHASEGFQHGLSGNAGGQRPYTFVEAANANEIPHPNIITEGGRSLAAHHSVLIMEVLETTEVPAMPDEFEVKEDDHQLSKDLYDIWCNINVRNML